MTALHPALAPAAAGPATPIHALRAAEWADWLAGRPQSLALWAQAHDFRAQAGRILLVAMTDGRVERALFGLGDAPDAAAFGALARDLPAGDYRLAAAPADLSASAIATAWALGAYQFARYKAAKPRGARLIAESEADAADASRIAHACDLIRDLVNTPAADMGPAALHAAAEALAARFGATTEAIVGEELLAQNYPMIHAVGRAAGEPPRLVILRWGRPGAARVSLVGKGVTFDSGGLNLKPGDGMRLMKKDMGGAAHALGLAQMVMEAGLDVRLQVYLPIVENAVDGAAFRPGDVLRARNGATVEIDNTDAEGRLILADALLRAQEDGCDLLIDLATLTGAARVALGPDLPPFYAGDDALAGEIERAAREAGDPVWRMPLWAAYQDDLDSPVADMKNSAGAMAGSITAALFLKRFVTMPAWAHFDIYAWAPKTKGAKVQGGDAQAVRALFRMLRARYG